MRQNTTQVHHISADELTTKILNGVESKLNEFEKNFQPKEPTIWITRKQVSKILSISMQTVHDWSKREIINPYKVGNLVRFKRSEVENALTKINS